MTGRPSPKLHALKFQGMPITPQDRKHAFIAGALGNTSPRLRGHQIGAQVRTVLPFNLTPALKMNFRAP